MAQRKSTARMSCGPRMATEKRGTLKYINMNAVPAPVAYYSSGPPKVLPVDSPELVEHDFTADVERGRMSMLQAAREEIAEREAREELAERHRRIAARQGPARKGATRQEMAERQILAAATQEANGSEEEIEEDLPTSPLEEEKPKDRKREREEMHLGDVSKMGERIAQLEAEVNTLKGVLERKNAMLDDLEGYLRKCRKAVKTQDAYIRDLETMFDVKK